MVTTPTRSDHTFSMAEFGGGGVRVCIPNNGQVEMRVFVGRVEDECLKNRAIHGLKDRINCSKLEKPP